MRDLWPPQPDPGARGRDDEGARALLVRHGLSRGDGPREDRRVAASLALNVAKEIFSQALDALAKREDAFAKKMRESNKQDELVNAAIAKNEAKYEKLLKELHATRIQSPMYAGGDWYDEGMQWCTSHDLTARYPPPEPESAHSMRSTVAWAARTARRSGVGPSQPYSVTQPAGRLSNTKESSPGLTSSHPPPPFAEVAASAVSGRPVEPR